MLSEFNPRELIRGFIWCAVKHTGTRVYEVFIDREEASDGYLVVKVSAGMHYLPSITPGQAIEEVEKFIGHYKLVEAEIEQEVSRGGITVTFRFELII
ncbi:hypothetical protein [Paludifilum halophilum]|uniref:Uncharacterized protein n=1 Tax=Paludifilum halophilum TaxID=1642702 RepID=A0A235B8I0_9BACL|nr:hypothetical protein [Paludifilum halophilum]OYD08532.1 hypothetical protein CHM34_06815 [Paludifilum halophilum]